MTDSPPPTKTVTVGVLTYRRPTSLLATLESLRDVATGPDQPNWGLNDVLVVDNDRSPSARDAVESLIADGYPHPVRYVHETSPGLAAARNRAMDEASGDVLAFIDDDEIAQPGWPGGLVTTMASTGAALVGGPVRTSFSEEPPSWIVTGGFFDRDEPVDAAAQTWLRSGNLAIDLAAIRAAGLRFDPAFGFTGGEDVAFSRSARQAGLELRWSATAVVVETVGPERTTLAWLTKRERNSTKNWVRVERQLDPSPLGLARISARGLIRLTQGVATTLVGFLTLNSITRSRGLVIAARGIGAFAGLTTRTTRTYRQNDDI